MYINNVNVQGEWDEIPTTEQEGADWNLWYRYSQSWTHDKLSKAGHKELKVHTVHRGRHLTVNLDKYSCGTERHTLGAYNVTKLATSWTQDWVAPLTDGKKKLPRAGRYGFRIQGKARDVFFPKKVYVPDAQSASY